MNCKKCGNPITNFDKFCQNCGEINELYNGGNETAPITENQAVTNVQNMNQQTVTQVPQEMPVTPSTPVAEPTPTTYAAQPQVSNVQPSNKKNNTLFIVLIVLFGIIIIGLGIFIATQLLGDSSDTSVSNNTNTNSQTTTVQETNENTGTTPSQVDSSNTYSFQGFTFTIPSGLKLVEAESMSFFSNEQTAIGFYKIFSMNFDVVKVNASSIESELNSEGEATVSSHKEYTINGIKYYIYEISYDDMDDPVDVFFASMGENLVMEGIIYNLSNEREVSYRYLESILSTAKFESSSFVNETDITVPNLSENKYVSNN